MKTIVAMTAATLLTTIAGQAAAQAEAPATASVSYADLDLSRASGRAVLERRVGLAVNRVCPERPSPSELGKMRTHRICRQTAWAGARQQLAAIYSGRQLAEASVRVIGQGN